MAKNYKSIIKKAKKLLKQFKNPVFVNKKNLNMK